METLPHRRLHLQHLHPSMEPQPFGHGNPTAPPAPPAAPASFNGATAFRPWKPYRTAGSTCSTCILQWSHSLSAMETVANDVEDDEIIPTFNGATAFRPWKPADLYRPWTHQKTFNGATAFRPWKHARYARGQRAMVNPSMEPQPFGHGNKAKPNMVVGGSASFNGATTFRPWKRGRLPEKHPGLRHTSMEPQPFGHGNGGVVRN